MASKMVRNAHMHNAPCLVVLCQLCRVFCFGFVFLDQVNPSSPDNMVVGPGKPFYVVD